MSIDTTLSAAQLIVAVLAILISGGGVFYLKRRNSQNQKIGDHSIGIQSGNDVEINSK